MRKTATLLSLLIISLCQGSYAQNQARDVRALLKTGKTTARLARQSSVIHRVGEPTGGGFYLKLDSVGFFYASASAANPSDITYYQWINGAYLLKETSALTFNAQGDVTSASSRIWTGTGWQNSTRQTYNYDAANNLLLYKVEQWDLLSNTWQPSTRDTFMVNTSNERIGRQVDRWNNVSNMWYSVSRESFQYDAPGNLTAQALEEYDTTNQIWIPRTRVLNTYDITNTLIGKVNQNSDGAGGWINLDSMHVAAANNSGYPLIVFNFNWNTNRWILADRTTYTYFTESLETSMLRETWSGSAFAPVKRSFKSYDPEGNILADSSETAHGTLWTIDAADYYHSYRYEGITAADVPVCLSGQTLITPNPTRDRLHISPGANVSGLITVSVYAMNGQLVDHREFQATGTMELPVHQLISGQYLLELKGNATTDRFLFTKAD